MIKSLFLIQVIQRQGQTQLIRNVKSFNILQKLIFFIHIALIIFWLKIDCDAEEYFGTPCMLFRTLWQVTLLICHGSYFWPDSLRGCSVLLDYHTRLHKILGRVKSKNLNLKCFVFKQINFLGLKNFHFHLSFLFQRTPIKHQPSLLCIDQNSK